jgi:diaminohydroxyphosphoribosylaminopyrimidine deaminase/5-amino-6-(5-phosphoribosylamino)uracil reductase
MATPSERDAMARALQLAARGRRGVNPQVGAVLLSGDGERLAEGWHRGAGTAHAEIEALSHLDRAELPGTTMVVTLEPCNHTGRTGPCAQALIEVGVSRVVYAVADPGEHSGGGAQRLREAGIDVEAGVLADQAQAQLESWFTVQRLGRPHISVKWAQSLDGRAAAADGTSQWITGSLARADAHRRRAQADAIVVGTGTLLADDPALTARALDGSLYADQPLPVVVGRRPIPAAAAVREHPRGFYHFEGTLFDDSDPDGSSLLTELRARGVHRVLVEGGPGIASAFLRAGLADEVLIYLAPTLIGRGADGADRPALTQIGVDTIDQQQRLQLHQIVPLGEDVLFIATPNPKGI